MTDAAARVTQTTHSQRRIHPDAPLLLYLVALVLIASVVSRAQPAPLHLAIGMPGDRVFLERTYGVGGTTDGSWFGDELAPGTQSGRVRWSQQDSRISVPVAGVTGLTIEAAGWPTAGSQPTVTVLIDAVPVGGFTPTTAYQTYDIPLPMPSQGDAIDITLRTSGVLTDTNGYRDPRLKGVRVSALTLAPSTGGTLEYPLHALALWYAVLAITVAALPVRRRLRAVFAAVAVMAFTLGLRTATAAVVASWPVALAAGGMLLAFTQRRHLQTGLGGLWRRAHRQPGLVHWAGWLTLSGAVGAGLQATSDPVYGWAALLWLGALGALSVVGRWPHAAVLGQRLVPFGRLAIPVVWAVLAAAVVAGVVAAPFIGHADYADNAVVARNLVAGRGWVVDYVTQFYQIYPSVTHPQETWPLLQPVWIALSFLLFGVDDAAARLPNALFWGVLVWHVARHAQLRWGAAVATVAVVLATVNIFVFRQLIYATTDIAFVAFSTAAIHSMWLAVQPAASKPTPWYQNQVSWMGVWTGLMLLQKPGSAAMLAVGMGVWFLWQRVWLVRTDTTRLWAGIRDGIVWGGIAVVILSPYVVRNLLLYGSPAHSTEALDAWILEYTQWDAIYRVYAADGGIGSGDLPERSWLLRWGFDAILHKLTVQYTVLQDYLLPSTAWFPAPLTQLGAAPAATGLLAPLALWALCVGAVRLAAPRGPQLRGLLVAALLPYILFMTVYWHANEPRYWVMLIPWMAIGAARGFFVVAGVVAQGVGRQSRLFTVTLVSGAVVLALTPIIGTIQSTWTLDRTRTAADRDMYSFLRANTQADAVMMTRVPWQLQWYSARGAVMIPADADAVTLLRIARHYRARYLVLDSLQRPNAATRAMIAAMLADPHSGFRLVYRTPEYPVNDNGRAFTMQSEVYAFPPEYGGVAPIW